MEHKIGIMMCYFERPNMVRFALESIKRQGYTNWELCFVDDTATRSGEESVRDMFGDDPRVFYYCTEDTPERKSEQGGSRMCKFWNTFILSRKTDVNFVLCDDDYLRIDYLEKLNQWYSDNPKVMYAHSDVVQYNPFDTKELYEIPEEDVFKPYTNYKGRTLPDRTLGVKRDSPAAGQCDASYVSWKSSTFTEDGVRFPDVQAKQSRDFDAAMFSQLDGLYHHSTYTGIIGQYKGTHPDQFGPRADGGTLNKTRDINFAPY
jgi:glycosyltransferase involved in cell wall biosynthesis